MIFAPDLFAGRRVLITGGGTGLGRMMAEHLLSLGASVEIWGRRASVLEDTVAEMNAEYPGQARCQAVDIKDAEAVDAAIQASLLESHDHEALRCRAQDFAVPRIADQYLAYFRSMGAQL